MGMGSGTGSHALAALYPGLQVIGVDVSEEMVAIATERYALPNLSFRTGDVATRVFEDGSLDAILDSSVLHHVTSFGGYDRAAAMRALAVQVDALRDHGVLVVRDFLDPGDDPVVLELPRDDGTDDDAVTTCTTARLFDRFAREFRSLAPAPGCAFEELPAVDPSRRRVALPHRLAVEFVLRKDYRADWVTEIMEEYTYATQAEFEAAYQGMGLRVIASVPIRNPWILRHRFAGKFRLSTPDRAELDPPATNYVIVGEKVPSDCGVEFCERPHAPTGFLRLDAYRDRATGRAFDLVARPHLTIDALPWFEHDGDAFVLARMSYPRPILRAAADPPLDGSRSPQYVTEPMTVVQDDAPIAQTIEEALADRAGIAATSIRAFEEGPVFFPSPGGVREEIRTALVEIDPLFVQPDVPERSGFSASGRIAAIEATQLLRAAQVGGIADARLELGVHALLRRRGRSPGPWIGEAAIVPESTTAPRTNALAELRSRPPRRAYVRATSTAGFLEIRAGAFDEHNATGEVLHTRVLEYVVPASLGTNTVVVAPLRRHGGQVFLGLADEDRPAAQCLTGRSDLWVVPAWRVPRDVTGIRASRAWLAERLEREHGLVVGELFELGGRYHPSSGTTPEVVFPHAAAVVDERPCVAPLTWVELSSLLGADELLRDGHTRVVAWRAAHALGLLA
jgi:SAM-dependent methyltransferase